MGSGNKSDNLTAAYIDHMAVIRVEGRGSFKVSPSMKQFIHQVIAKKSADRIVLDMSDCTGMDSTFMGVIAGLACLIKSKPEFKFKLINLSDKNKKLLVTLGVDRVVDFSLASEKRTPNSTTARFVGRFFPPILVTNWKPQKQRSKHTKLWLISTPKTSANSNLFSNSLRTMSAP